MEQQQRSVLISDRSAIGQARRVAVSAANALGFDEDACSNIGIVATELATNVLVHANSGEVLVCPWKQGDCVMLDVLALDSGPGMPDVSQAMEDGYSTLGTAGQGLGAIRRLSSRSFVHSVPQRGSVVWSRFLLPGAVEMTDCAAVSLPLRGETASGDGFLALPGKSRSLYMVVDGLGHGAGAQEAADVATAAVVEHQTEGMADILIQVHQAMRATRGAAMSLAEVDHEKMLVKYAGVGNISASLTGVATRSLVSQNGTLGAVLPRVQEYTYPFTAGSTLLMFSDGLNSRCNASGYPGVVRRYLQVLSALLYRDFVRGRDDATILTARLESATS